MGSGMPNSRRERRPAGAAAASARVGERGNAAWCLCGCRKERKWAADLHVRWCRRMTEGRTLSLEKCACVLERSRATRGRAFLPEARSFSLGVRERAGLRASPREKNARRPREGKGDRRSCNSQATRTRPATWENRSRRGADEGGQGCGRALSRATRRWKILARRSETGPVDGGPGLAGSSAEVIEDRSMVASSESKDRTGPDRHPDGGVELGGDAENAEGSSGAGWSGWRPMQSVGWSVPINAG